MDPKILNDKGEEEVLVKRNAYREKFCLSRNMNQKRTDVFDGIRDHLNVEAWLYSDNSYIWMVQIGSQIETSDSEKLRSDAKI